MRLSPACLSMATIDQMQVDNTFVWCSSMDDVDYDAMLAATRKHKKEDQEGHGDDDDSSMQSSDHVGSQDPDDMDDGASDSGDSRDKDKELLPTEDDFLRLEDMEKFLQVSLLHFCKHS